MNPAAPVFVSRWGARRYSRPQLLELEAASLHPICHGPAVDHPPFHQVPVSLVPWLKLRCALEFVDVDHASLLVQTKRVSPSTGGGGTPTPAGARAGSRDAEARGDDEEGSLLHYYCAQCASGPRPCQSIGDLIVQVKRQARTSRLGAVLLQSGDVVKGQLQVALAFGARQTSVRMRMLADHCPDVVQRVQSFLCGDGFHLALPPLVNRDEWRQMNALLKFDWIRDSRTRIFTELSKYWKKRNTPFEQFVHFFFYRDDRPVHAVKNMITHSLKPVLVAVLSGDVVAVVLLAELGFFVPPDYFWTIFPFFAEALDQTRYATMRHLCAHYSVRQRARGEARYNPIEDPRAPRTPPPPPPPPCA